MPNYNNVTLIGHVTRDPELRNLQGGSAVVNFGIAVNREWTKDGNKQSETCFVDVAAFGKQAEVLEKYVKKGDPIFIAGRLKQDSWEKDGQKRTKLSVIVENFQFLRAGGDGGGAKTAPAAKKTDAAVEDNDIPF